MQADDRQRLSWTVRHDCRSELDRELLEDLVQVAKEACAAEFPSGDGYVTSVRRLSGALEGVSIRISRGQLANGGDDFSALISIQRYVRSQERTTTEIRVVASSHHRSRARTNGAAGSALSRWGVTGCAVGTMGAGFAGLELSGLLASWGQALLLIPALMVWRMCMVVRMASNLRQQARPALVEDPAIARAHQRDRHRWKRVTDLLLAQRDTMTERTTMRPFRSQGPQPHMRGLNAPQRLPPAVLRVPALPT